MLRNDNNRPSFSLTSTSRTTTLGLAIAAALAIVMTLTVNTALSSPPTNATTTVSNVTSATPIYEQHSETHGNRVIGVTNGSAKLEVSYSGNGFAKSIYTVIDQGSSCIPFNLALHCSRKQ